MEPRKMILMNLGSREGMWDADIDNELGDTVEEGKSETNGESSVDIYTRPCVKQRASEKFLYNTRSPAWCSVII